MFTIIAKPSALHQAQHQLALHKGLKAIGVDSVLAVSPDTVSTKKVACWGWRIGKRLRDRGHEVLVMERSYIGDRFFYSSLGWNGLNGHATFPEYPSDGGERFRSQGGVIQPWKEQGKGYALILGQVPKDASLKGQKMEPWYEKKAQEIKDTYNIPVHFRPHPDVKKKGIKQVVRGIIPSEGDLKTAIDGAEFTVCYNSNSAVDSVLMGTPCIIGDDGTMAKDMCSKDIKEIIKPEREQWAYSLAFKQWTLDEITEGLPLKALV